LNSATERTLRNPSGKSDLEKLFNEITSQQEQVDRYADLVDKECECIGDRVMFLLKADLV
jgi:hypothetical protein